jgi:hypothetical protein
MELVEAGVELAVTVGTSVEVFWVAEKVRFLPSYLKSDVPNHLVQDLTLHRLGSRCRINVFFTALKVC